MASRPSPIVTPRDFDARQLRKEQAWTVGPSIDAAKVREKRAKSNFNSPLQVVELDLEKPTPRLTAISHKVVPSEATPKPPALNLPETGSPETNIAEVGPSPDAVDLVEKLDVPNDNFIPEDAFEKAVEAVVLEHQRQVDAFRKEIEERNEKLNVVLSTTWGFSEEGWHAGSPTEADAGTLDLVCSKEGVSNALWTVSEDEQTVMQNAQPNSRFKARNAWKSYDWAGGTEQLNKLDLPERRHSTTVFVEQIQYAAAKAGQKESRCSCSKFIAHPASTQRLCWDLSGMVLLLWDVVMIPLGAYDPPRTALIKAMDWVTLIFWTFDIFASFFTGVLYKGVTIMAPIEIAKRYMIFWFWIDLAVVFPEWIMTILSMTLIKGENGAGNATGLLRTVRMVRVLRLLRMAKIRRLIAQVKDQIHSEAVFLLVSIVQFVIGLIFMNHFMAAGWYWMGITGRWMESDNWIDKHDLKNAALAMRYFNSLQWSLSQFAYGWIDVKPYNEVEFIFSIFILILGMVTISTFVAFLTKSISQLNNMGADNTKQFWLLRRYLKHNRVPNILRVRLLRYLEYATSQQKDIVPVERLVVLNLLSDQLKAELKYVVNFGSLLGHPLFKYAQSLSEVVMHSLADKVFNIKQLAINDVHFQVGSLPPDMGMIVCGSLHYVKYGDEDLHLREDDWFCEPAIWTSWACRGNLVADSECQVILVDVKLFAEAMQTDEELWPAMTAYAEIFVDWLNHLEFAELTDVSIAYKSRPRIEGFVEDSQGLKAFKTQRAQEEEEKEKKRQMNRAKYGFDRQES